MLTIIMALHASDVTQQQTQPRIMQRFIDYMAKAPDADKSEILSGLYEVLQGRLAVQINELKSWCDKCWDKHHEKVRTSNEEREYENRLARYSNRVGLIKQLFDSVSDSQKLRAELSDVLRNDVQLILVTEGLGIIYEIMRKVAEENVEDSFDEMRGRSGVVLDLINMLQLDAVRRSSVSSSEVGLDEGLKTFKDTGLEDALKQYTTLDNVTYLNSSFNRLITALNSIKKYVRALACEAQQSLLNARADRREKEGFSAAPVDSVDSLRHQIESALHVPSVERAASILLGGVVYAAALSNDQTLHESALNAKAAMEKAAAQ